MGDVSQRCPEIESKDEAGLRQPIRNKRVLFFLLNREGSLQILLVFFYYSIPGLVRIEAKLGSLIFLGERSLRLPVPGNSQSLFGLDEFAI